MPVVMVPLMLMLVLLRYKSAGVVVRCMYEPTEACGCWAGAVAVFYVG